MLFGDDRSISAGALISCPSRLARTYQKFADGLPIRGAAPLPLSARLRLLPNREILGRLHASASRFGSIYLGDFKLFGLINIGVGPYK